MLASYSGKQKNMHEDSPLFDVHKNPTLTVFQRSSFVQVLLSSLAREPDEARPPPPKLATDGDRAS